METLIKTELVEFEKYHKNKYNVYFHIVCGFFYMTFLLLLFKNSNLLLFIYSLILLITMKNLCIVLTLFIILFLMIYFIKKLKLSTLNLMILFIFFYFLPDVSHYIVKEPSIINISNITPISLFINIFYLLPFSIYLIPNVLYLNQ